jgi:predicted enzyme related to lactoylglutathione lyase
MPALPTQAALTFLYYKDLPAAAAFYENVLGLTLSVDQGWCRIYQITPGSFVGLVDSEHGTHKASEIKPVILAFVTEDVDAWYEHLQKHGVRFKNPLATHESIGIRGFMAYDPEGYTLEFETFLDRPRNTAIRAAL